MEYSIGVGLTLTVLQINNYLFYLLVFDNFQIDNRGRHIISADDSALNTPAVGAGLAIRTYVAQAPDELSFKVCLSAI